MNRHIFTLVIGSIILGVAVVLAALPNSEPAVEKSDLQNRPVQLATVDADVGQRMVRLPGVTRASDRASLSFVVPGRLATRPVDVGDQVRAGQVVATLDAREYQLAAEAAQASVNELDVRLAQGLRDLARVERLVDAKAATTEEVEQVQAATEALQAARTAAAARLNETRRLVSEARLLAPFAGTVTAAAMEPGEWASPGSAVIELSGSGNIEVAVEVPEAVRARLGEGETVAIELPFSGRRVEGRVTSVATAASGPGHLFPVEVTLEPGSGVLAGSTAEVILTTTTEPQITVPLEAVVNPGATRPAVFRVVDGTAHQVFVELGDVLGDRVAVRGELAAGDQVVVSGHTSLADGDQVEVF
jgi:RND family efflux transporter MFP subunit